MADMTDIRRVVDRARAEKRKILSEYEGKQLLSQIGVAVPEGQLVETGEEACTAANRLGYPVVMKVHSALISHKSDLGGVLTGIPDRKAAAEAWEKLMKIVRKQDPGGRVLVEQMAPPGMIEQVRGYRLLTGYRGQPAVNLQALQKLLLQVSELVEKVPELSGIDLNPVLVHSQGAIVLDSLMELNGQD